MPPAFFWDKNIKTKGRNQIIPPYKLKRHNQMIVSFMAGPLGIEPRSQDLESWILTVEL